MFEKLRQTVHDATLGVGGTRDGRAAALMRDAVVEAKVGVAALREALEETRSRLEGERRELETVRRRGRLAGGVGDAETVRVAERFEARHAERVSVLAGTLAAQERELELAEREVAEMTAELQRTMRGIAGSAQRGVAGGAETEPGAAPATGASAESLRREVERVALDAEAERQLLELKRRMRR